MKYEVTKTYGNERGLSACFRQWRASGTHCRFLHGYALGFRFTFASDALDDRNWVYSFGDCKWIKTQLEDWFDHKTVISKDDPELLRFHDMEKAGLIQLRVMPTVGCEAFAEAVFKKCAPLIECETGGRVKLLRVECFEHASNSAAVRA